MAVDPHVLGGVEHDLVDHRHVFARVEAPSVVGQRDGVGHLFGDRAELGAHERVGRPGRGDERPPDSSSRVVTEQVDLVDHGDVVALVP